jgi:hypothetical protein
MPKNPGQIDIGKQFSRFPAGRTAKDGEYSGQVFLKKLIWPALKNHDRIVIILDNALSYGSSFLEESFGGLIRDRILTRKEFDSKLEFVSSDEYLLAELASYVNDATERLNNPDG